MDYSKHSPSTASNATSIGASVGASATVAIGSKKRLPTAVLKKDSMPNSKTTASKTSPVADSTQVKPRSKTAAKSAGLATKARARAAASLPSEVAANASVTAGAAVAPAAALDETVTPKAKVKGLTPATGWIGFGVHDEFGGHVFVVDIPASQSGTITITEDYGLKGGENGIPEFEKRVAIPRHRWSSISEIARKDFIARLKTKKIPAGRWVTGPNKVDRMFGKELCVLAWAVEHATSNDEAKVIAAKWAALTPEERWWLFSQTVAEAGLPEDKEIGWRKALYFALAGGKDKDRKPRAPRPIEDMAQGRLI